MVWASQEDMRQMLEQYDTWVFDLDGTLWKGNTLIDGVEEALALLREHGKRLLFITNNSTKSRAAFKAKFDAVGLPAERDEIYSSSYSAAAYLRSAGFSGRRVYVVGERGIMEELAAAGIEAVGGPDDNGKTLDGKPLNIDPEIGAVVCGVDPGLNYYKVTYASLCIRHNPGCLFIATNRDSRGHFIETQEWPGAGATAAAVQAVVEREPIVTGKPAPFMCEDVCRTHGTEPSRMLMIGDRLDTDMAFGHATGMGTLLVLTGVVSEQDLAEAAAQPGFTRPHYIMHSFADLLAVKDGAHGVRGHTQRQHAEVAAGAVAR